MGDHTTELLKKIYYDPQNEGSYGGIEKLFRAGKKAGIPNLTRANVKQFLTDQQAYSLHKPPENTL